jgi:hypothetical protein
MWKSRNFSHKRHGRFQSRDCTFPCKVETNYFERLQHRRRLWDLCRHERYQGRRRCTRCTLISETGNWTWIAKKETYHFWEILLPAFMSHWFAQNIWYTKCFRLSGQCCRRTSTLYMWKNCCKINVLSYRWCRFPNLQSPFPHKNPLNHKNHSSDSRRKPQ